MRGGHEPLKGPNWGGWEGVTALTLAMTFPELSKILTVSMGGMVSVFRLCNTALTTRTRRAKQRPEQRYKSDESA